MAKDAPGMKGYCSRNQDGQLRDTRDDKHVGTLERQYRKEKKIVFLHLSHPRLLHHPRRQRIRQFVVVGTGEEGLEKLVHLDFFKDGLLDILFLQCLCMFLCPEIKEDEVFG